MNLCKDCWHVTDLDHCPGCGATETNRLGREPVFIADVTRDDVRAEMLRERDRVAAEASQIDWLSLNDIERDEARWEIGVQCEYAWDMGGGPWITIDHEKGVTIGMWITEQLGDDDPDAWNVDDVDVRIGDAS